MRVFWGRMVAPVPLDSCPAREPHFVWACATRRCFALLGAFPARRDEAPKQIENRKPRKGALADPVTQPASSLPPVVHAVPLQMPAVTAMATPIPFAMMHAPLVAATALPIATYTPPVLPLP